VLPDNGVLFYRYDGAQLQTLVSHAPGSAAIRALLIQRSIEPSRRQLAWTRTSR
jgi:hypothetical protein